MPSGNCRRAFLCSDKLKFEATHISNGKKNAPKGGENSLSINAKRPLTTASSVTIRNIFV